MMEVLSSMGYLKAPKKVPEKVLLIWTDHKKGWLMVHEMVTLREMVILMDRQMVLQMDNRTDHLTDQKMADLMVIQKESLMAPQTVRRMENSKGR